MGEFVILEAADGHELVAYRVEAGAARKGSMVVIQEIFGVNAHIRDVCDRYAKAGYDAIAPALFDRVKAGVELDYIEDDIAEGRELSTRIGWDDPMLDIQAAASNINPVGKSGVVGYCWGASWAWLAACRLDMACAVCYYGRHIVDLVDEQPLCPVMMHFGALDASIPMATVDKIRMAYPDIPMHIYEDAGHGFNCDRREDFRSESADLALERTLAFIAESM